MPYHSTKQLKPEREKKKRRFHVGLRGFLCQFCLQNPFVLAELLCMSAEGRTSPSSSGHFQTSDGSINILRPIEAYAPEVHGKIPHKSASGPGRTSSRIFLRDSRTVTYRPLAPGLLLDPIIIDLRGVQCSYIGSPPSQAVL